MLNLHITPGDFTHGSRILKETASLARQGIADEIVIISPPTVGLPEHQVIDDKRSVQRIDATVFSRSNLLSKLFTYVGWQLVVFFRFKDRPVRYVNAHALSVLPVGVLFRLLRRSRLIYDAHELETETLDMVGIRQKLARFTERLLIPYADVVIVVNETIAAWYRKQYGLNNVYVVKNVPVRPAKPPDHSMNLKRKLGIQENEILFLFQGNFRTSRNIELLLDTFATADKGRHILFLGYGALEKKIKEYTHHHPNIHFQPAVPPEEVVHFSSGADVGICVFEKHCLNHFYALPNKIYEYIMSGLPLIVNDFPEMKSVVDEGQCGWTWNHDKDLSALINTLSFDEINAKRKNAQHYRQQIGWQHEELALFSAFDRLKAVKR